MVTAQGSDTPYQVVVDNGAFQLKADVGADKGGGGQGFRPHELLEAALASCMTMTVQMYARHHELPLEGASVRVELDRSEAGKAVFRYALTLEGPLSDEARQRLEAAVRACPVHKTLLRTLEIKPVSA